MKSPILFFGTFFVFFCNTGYIHSQSNNLPLSGNYLNTITTAVPFLLVAVDSRAGGVGDAGVAGPVNANSSFWNASKLAMSKNRISASFNYVPWLRKLVPDLYLYNLNFNGKPTLNSACGISFVYFSLGPINLNSSTGTTNLSWPREFTLNTYYSIRLGRKFSVGLAGKYIKSDLVPGIVKYTPGISYAGDISCYYIDTLTRVLSLAFGLNASNIGTKISYLSSPVDDGDFIPANLRIGTCLGIKIYDGYSLSIIIDANKMLVPSPPIRDKNRQILMGRDNNVSVAQGIFQSFTDAPGGVKEELREIILSGGIEQLILNHFFLRTGYFYLSEYKGDLKYFTWGTGVTYKYYEFNVSYINAPVRSPLDGTIKFGGEIRF